MPVPRQYRPNGWESNAVWLERARNAYANYSGSGRSDYFRRLQSDFRQARTAVNNERLQSVTAPRLSFSENLRAAQERAGYTPRREDGPMPTNTPPPGANPDPFGNPRTHPQWNAGRLPDGFPRGTCTCASCVRAYLNDYGIPRRDYDPARYVEIQPPRTFLQTYYSLQGVGDPAGHRLRPSRWSAYEHEAPFPRHFEGLINVPLKYILRRSGRVWSAEVEVNELNTRRCADILGVQTRQYSYRPDRAAIVASSDATTDAEIKISCMRDGSTQHATMARETYRTLFDNGARVAHNAGHHVHVDGTRLADAGVEVATNVSRAAFRLLALTRAALHPLATSGYKAHRGSSTYWNDESVMMGRQAFHGSRLYQAARSGHDQNATLEYRLPNATLWPIRAQSFIAVPLGALDWAERAVMDDDSKAADQLRLVNDRTGMVSPFGEVEAAEFLLQCVNFSKDSRKAMAIAAFTSPASKKHVAVWEQAAEFARGLDSLDTEARELVTVTAAKAKSKKSADTEPRTIGGEFEHPDDPLPIPPLDGYGDEQYFDDDDYYEED